MVCLPLSNIVSSVTFRIDLDLFCWHCFDNCGYLDSVRIFFPLRELLQCILAVMQIQLAVRREDLDFLDMLSASCHVLCVFLELSVYLSLSVLIS